jgi:hypothetical protein
MIQLSPALHSALALAHLRRAHRGGRRSRVGELTSDFTSNDPNDLGPVIPGATASGSGTLSSGLDNLFSSGPAPTPLDPNLLGGQIPNVTQAGSDAAAAIAAVQQGTPAPAPPPASAPVPASAGTPWWKYGIGVVALGALGYVGYQEYA